MGPWKSASSALMAEDGLAFVASAPVVLYSVVIANESGTNFAQAGVYNGEMDTGYIDFSIPAGGTVVWTGCLALPKGLSVLCETGAVRATVMYV